jgi:single-stranded-DNA-specific exonuclease
MCATPKRWRTIDSPVRETATLRNELKIHPILCGILAHRGIDNFDKAKFFFRPDLGNLHDPFLMKDMQVAVERVIDAMANHEKILVYGDYDVDGTTSVAIVYDFLTKIYDKEQLEFYIPDRYREGYGLSSQGIAYAAEHNFSLLITLDCGIKSVELIASAKAMGIDTIVCDHHLPGADLPPAFAILNAKQPDCHYPYKELCGCGVGFKLIQGLSVELGLEENEYLPYLELVATAIAADIVPITGENRILAYHGIKQVNSNPSTGIRALIELSGSGKEITIGSLSFMIGPRINAAGRMDDAKKAVSLFIEKDPEHAKTLAAALQTDNNSRREADAQITEEAVQMLLADPALESKKSTVVFDPGWHKGVIGIVASRLLEKYYRPTIVITRSGEILAGSARSIPGFNIHDGLEHCSDLLLGFGGHYFAAGMTLMPEKLAAFQQRFEEIASAQLTEDQLVPEIVIDAITALKDLTPSFFRILQQMEPFGPENLRPVFCLRNVRNSGCRVVKDEHVRFEVEQDGARITGIGFNMAERLMLLEDSSRLDIVFTLEENNFRGVTSLQMKVIDFDMAGKKWTGAGRS